MCFLVKDQSFQGAIFMVPRSNLGGNSISLPWYTLGQGVLTQPWGWHYALWAFAPTTHTTSNMHTWGGVQLHIVVWDSYVQILTFVTRETSNDKFTIQEPVLLVANKRRVTHHPRVIKNKKQTWPTTSTINQANKVILWAKRIRLYGVHLGLLP